MKFIFEINERAVGKQRPRYSSRVKGMYTPIETITFEEKVKTAFINKYNIQTEASKKPFKAKIIATFKPGETYSKKKREQLLTQIYAQKPDVDNIAKSVLDSLNGLAYKDDRQVSALEVYKEFGIENKIYVELEEC